MMNEGLKMICKLFGFFRKPAPMKTYRVTLTFVYPTDDPGPHVNKAVYPPVQARNVLDAIQKAFDMERSTDGYYVEGYTSVHACVEEISG
jgi:hypothetical protein